MKYSTSPPTKPGDYRWRRSGAEPYQLMRLAEDAVHSGIFTEMLVRAHEMGGEWCGPLVAAEEVKRAFVEGYNSQFSSADSTVDGQFARSRAGRVAKGEEVIP